MDALIKLAHLSEEDVLSLPERVAENLAIAFDSVSHEASEAKERLHKCEKQHELEVKALQDNCSSLKAERESLKASLSSLRAALTEEEGKNVDLSRERDELDKKLTENFSVSTELERAIRNLENDKEILNELLNKKIFDCDKISAELSEAQSEIRSARRMKSEAITQLEEAKTAKELLALREKRIEESTESIKNQNAWLEEELYKRNDQLLSIRRDNCEKLINLESELASKKAELEHSQSRLALLEEQVKNLTKSNEDHIEKLRLRTGELENMEQIHANELEAQRRLTELYKKQSVDIEEKYLEMQKAISEMQEMLKQAHEQVLRLKSEKAGVVENFRFEQEKLAAENRSLQNELNAAKEIVDKFRITGLSEEELRKLNPAVATTIASLKRGRSLTEIYSDYVQVVEERDLLKLDKQRLSEHLREIMSQLEEKAPILRSQQEAYHKMKGRISELETMLEAAQLSVKDKEDMVEDQRRRSGYYQRENARLKQSVRDHAKQVKILLFELESARGTVITSSTEEVERHYPHAFPDSSTDDIDSQKLLNACNTANSAAGSIIDENLVTFRGLADLQSQNARLLLVARDLATQLEEHESDKSNLTNQLSEIKAQVEVLAGELDVTRLAASEARSEAELAKRQKEAFKSVLQRYAIPLPELPTLEGGWSHKNDGLNLSNYETSIVPVCMDQSLSVLDRTAGSAHSIHQSQTVSKLEESLCALHAEFKQYRKDKAKSDEVYSETIEKLRKESTDARILNQKLAAQLDFTHEKFRTLESNVANYKQEITILREMNARYTTSAAASDEALQSLREESARVSDRLAASEVECRQLIRQLEYARANEERLSKELELNRKTSLMHEHLMNQLQSIQVNLEHREESDARRTARRIEALETELAELKQSSSEKQEQLFTFNTALQSELSNAREALRNAEEEVSQLREAVANAKQLPTSCTCASLNRPTQSSSSGSANEDVSASVGVLSGDAATQLRNLERECGSLRVSLEAVRKQCAEYQQLGNDMEEHIAQLTREREQLEQEYSTGMEDLTQRCELLNLQLTLENSERQDLIQEKARLSEDFQASMKRLRDELSTVQAALKEADERRDAALKVEMSARSEVAIHQRLAQEAREKYETELQLHSQDVQLLTEARKQAEDTRAELESLRIALESAKTSLQQSEERLAIQNSLWEESRARLVKRSGEADSEIERLQEQILKLSEQIVQLRKLLEGTSDQSFSLDDSLSYIKESEDFKHTLEYLRRKKAIAEAAEETANAEVSRLHLRTKTLEHQVADLQEKLAEERRKSELRLETASQHANLMKQVEQVNLLSESNRLLRQERETVREAAARFEQQLMELRREVEPLRSQHKELEDTREILLAEKRSLTEERDRWKERCTRLVETSKRLDPEEYKQACNARAQLQARLDTLEEAKANSDREAGSRITALEQKIAELSSCLAQRESEGQGLTSRLTSLEEQIKVQENELTQRQIKITKLREIGRKYRQEADELKRQLSTTEEKEASMKTTEDTIAAVRADLLNAQANLKTEQEKSLVLRQEIQHLQQLVDRIEALPDLEPLRESSPESLIGTNLPASSNAPGTYNRLNHLLSVMLSEFYRMRSEAEEQSEKILRMQLIESQLAKTKRRCSELQAQLTAALTEAASNEPPPPTSTTVAVDTLAKSSEVTAATTSGCGNGSSNSPAWGVRAAAAVQPVQTPPPATTASPGSRQTAEIRPLPNFVATVPPAAAGAPIETVTDPLQSSNSNSYLAPLIPQPVETDSTTEINAVEELQPQAIVSMMPVVRCQVLLSASTTDEQPESNTLVAPTHSVATSKRTYEEALLSEEQHQVMPVASTSTKTPTAKVDANVLGSPPPIQGSKRLKVADISGNASAIRMPSPVNEVLEVSGEGGSTHERNVDGTVNQPLHDPTGEADGDREGTTTEAEYNDEPCLMIDSSNERHANEEAGPECIDADEEHGDGDQEENGDFQEEFEGTEGQSERTDCEGEEADDDEDSYEGQEMEEEDPEGPEEGADSDNPVIVLSSDEEGSNRDDGEEQRGEGDDQDEEMEEDVETDNEDEDIDDGQGDSSRDREPVTTEDDDESLQPQQLEAVKKDSETVMPATTVPKSCSLFSGISTSPPAVTSGGLFNLTPSPGGGLFPQLKQFASSDPKTTTLFGSALASGFRPSLFSGLTTSQSGSSAIRPLFQPGPASDTAKPACSTSDSHNPGSGGGSKQKIQPIVWSESPDALRKSSASASAVTSGAFGGQASGTGRRKIRGSLGAAAGKGPTRGGHR